MLNLIKFIFPFILISLSYGQSKKTFRQSIYYGPDTLNPYTSSHNSISNKIRAYIHETFFVKDPDSREWLPNLAEKYTISKDKKVFDFFIKKNIAFSDGKKLTAEDVLFSYKSIYDDRYKGALLRRHFDHIKKAEIIGPYHIRFHTKSVNYFSLYSLAFNLKILPKHYYGDLKNMKKFSIKVVGTGPYTLDDYKKNKSITLKRNENWWGRKNFNFNKKYLFPYMKFKIVRKYNVAQSLLHKGKIDMLFISERDMKNFKKNSNIVLRKVQHKGTKGMNSIFWNLDDPILKDKTNRFALDQLINRKFIKNKLSEGPLDYVKGPAYPGSPYESDRTQRTIYNPNVAVSSLKENGWEDKNKDGILEKKINGVLLNFEIDILAAAQSKKITKYLVNIQESAKKYGVKINIKTLEWNTINTLLDERKYQGAFIGHNEGGINWNPKLMYHSSAIKNKGNNFFNYRNEKVDHLIDKVDKEFDQSKRKKLLTKIYEIIASDKITSYLFSNRYYYYATQNWIHVPRDTFQYKIGMDYWSFQHKK